MKRFLMAVFLAAFYLPAWAAEEVDGSNLTADVNACDYEPAKGKLYKTKTGRTLDCRRYYVMSLYGYQGSEGNVSMGMDPKSMCQGTIYYCDYIGNGKFKRKPINLSYVGNQCKSDHKLIGVRFEAVNGSYAASKRLASGRLSHQCPDEEKPKPDDGKKPEPDKDDGKKPKPDDGKKPEPDDGKKPQPDDGKKPKPDDGKKPEPDDGKKPEPDDDKKNKPDDGNKPDKSMEDLLRRINDSLDRLNKNIEKSGSGSGGSGNGGGGHGSGNGGSGNGGGGHGSGGSGNGNGNGNGNGDHSGDGYSPPKDPDWGRLGGVKASTYSKDGRFSEVGACPKPVTFNLTVLRLSQTFAFSYEHVCDLAVRMRPILIACAYFAAGLICLAALER